MSADDQNTLPVGTGEPAGAQGKALTQGSDQDAAATKKVLIASAGVPSVAQAVAAEIVKASRASVDTGNYFMVGMRGDKIVILTVCDADSGRIVTMEKDQALNLAAWLAVFADPDLTTLPRLVEEIKNT